jgi:diadenylate cyclase
VTELLWPLFVPGPKDLLQILLVAYVFYRGLRLLVGTRALHMVAGVLLLAVAYVAARLLRLDLLVALLETAFRFGALVAVILFQPELRSALARLGRNRLVRLLPALDIAEVAEEIAAAAGELARSKTGAIIALEREVGLGEYAESGVPLQARVSAPLLVTIFTPYSPLHDGAVIIRGDTIIAAAAILPLVQHEVPDRRLGTRHRAALGLSEETDALVVVVSEESGQISLAYRGQLLRPLDPERLADLLAGRAPLPA